MMVIDEIAPPEDGELCVVVGPTASGKTALAVELCERYDGEIVGADSVQVYRRFDVGSGKPSELERARAPHHLVDVADPLDHVDAAQYAGRAERAIDDIRRRGKRPIVCGGTFLWVKALLYGLAPSAPASPEVRARHGAIVASQGRAALHAELERVDPPSAARLAPNDFVRVSRALEIHELTGKTQSDWHAEHGFRQVRHRARLVGVWREREELDRRIAARTSAWLAGGWVAEVRQLVVDGYEHARAMGSVGYRQIREHLAGRIDGSELETAIVRATRVFVRRQRTWLNDQPVLWLRGL
jgi:tRNA dimethylallyltransferase